ncbi:hypothetical protein ACWEVD_08545 [Nocardia thailandica]
MNPVWARSRRVLPASPRRGAVFLALLAAALLVLAPVLDCTVLRHESGAGHHGATGFGATDHSPPLAVPALGAPAAPGHSVGLLPDAAPAVSAPATSAPARSTVPPLEHCARHAGHVLLKAVAPAAAPFPSLLLMLGAVLLACFAAAGTRGRGGGVRGPPIPFARRGRDLLTLVCIARR